MWRQRASLRAVVAEFWGDERRRMSDPAISTSWQSALMKGRFEPCAFVVVPR